MTRNGAGKFSGGYRILRLFFKDEEFRERIEDLEEILSERSASASGGRPRRMTAALQILGLILSRLRLSCYWSLSMARNYMTIARRTLLRNRIYSLITISGLSLGLAGFLLVSVWAAAELGYDRFHENAGSIYRVEERRSFPDHVENGIRTSGLLSAALRDTYPEIRKAARVAWTGERVIRHGKDVRYERDILCVDPEFLSLFSFPLRERDAASALGEPGSMLITESFASRYFGGKDPVGEVLILDEKMSFSVAGVLEDVPADSHLRFDALIPFEVVEELGWRTDTWNFSMALTYVELDKNADPQAFEGKIAGFVKSRDADSKIELVLQPLTRIWLYSSLGSPEGPGRIRYVVVFFLVGVLILLIACVNFMNLATARSESRAREIGLRKVVGAARSHIVRQFLLEAVFVAGLAFFLTPLLLTSALPSFNDIAGTSLTPADFMNGRALLIAAAAVLLTGLFSGSYPALVLSSLDPARIAKARISSGRKGSFLRRALVLAQVAASVILLIAASVIYFQVDYMKSKDIGFDKERVLSIPLGISNKENGAIYRRFRDIVDSNLRIAGVSAAFTHPTEFGTPAVEDMYYESRRLDEETPVSISSVEAGFIETLGIRLLEGRTFSGEADAERGNVIVNEAFRRLLGVESALGRTVRIGARYTGTIIGVVGDFHMESPSAGPIGPLLIFQNAAVNFIFARLGPGEISPIIEDIERAWREAAPQIPFKFSFLDEDFDSLYTNLDTLATMIRIFTIIAALIAGLGLFALASFAAERRRKEIGIRKVLGSTAREIWLMLSGEFVRLVAGACLVAWPIAWIIMRRWLADFSYRVDLSWEIFALSGVLASAAALLIVSIHTLKASRANPVAAIRNE